MPRFCTQCGAQVPDGNSFCANCGAQMTDTNASAGVNLNKGVIPDNSQSSQGGKNRFHQPRFDDQPFQQGQQNQQGQQSQPFQQSQQGQSFQQGQPFQQQGQPFAGGQGGFGGQGGYSGQGGYGQPQFAGQPGQGGFDFKAAIKKIPPKYLKFGGIGIAALILIIVIVNLFAGSSYKDPLENYKKVLEKGDTKAYTKCFFDEDVLMGEGDSSSKVKKTVKNMREDFTDRYGDDAKVTYKIKSKKALSKKLIKTYNSEITSWNLIGGNVNKYKIKSGYTLKVKFTYSGENDDKTTTKTLIVVETKDGWKFFNETPSSIYYW